jgi:CubicO group peptidase (beta-lactamase class C family)
MLGETGIRQLKMALSHSIVQQEIAGGNMLVLPEGKEIFYHEDGLADREAGKPIRRDTIFRLYSMSKPVTAAAAMILLERGTIDLYEPVSKYLPGFKNAMVEAGGKLVPAERDVTLKDLLSMTSGLVYGGADQAGRDTEALFREIDGRLLGDEPMSTVEIANRLGSGALSFQPGTAWQYGTSADVLGAVVEAASGMRFGEFLDQELFRPLEMTDTGFWLPEGKQSRLAKTYANDGNGGLELYTGNHLGIVHQMDRNPAFESGGAGLVSTIDDYARFAKMLMNEGCLEGVQILRPRTVQYLTTSTLNAEQHRNFDLWFTLAGYSYGNLMRVATDCGKAGGLASPGEYGWDGWLGCYFCNCPQDDLIFLFMMQQKDSGTTPLTRKLRNIVLSSCLR